MSTLVDLIAELGPQAVLDRWDEFTPLEQTAISQALADWETQAWSPSPPRDRLDLHPWQQPPTDDWSYYLLLGGRGSGKSQGAAAWFYDHVLNDPPCIPGVAGGHAINIIGPTQGDAAETARKDYLTLNPGEMRVVTRQGGTFVEFPNGATGRLLGANRPEDPERLRAAGNVCGAHAEELASWRMLGWENDAWDQMRQGTRLGVHKIIVSTTPKPIPKLREIHDLALSDDRRYVMTRGTTYDATHLPEDYRTELIGLFEGTRLEAQELLGLLLDYVAGALWTPEAIDGDRVQPDQVPALSTIAVGVDPDFSEEQTADEAGIIVAGLGQPPGASRLHGYVLADRTCRGGMVWPREAVRAYRDYQDEVRARGGGIVIVCEANLGGKDYLTRVLSVEDAGARTETVHARDRKETRAEPVALLYDQHLVHHVGTHAMLEQEMTTWVPGDKSPNRLDALVWALEHLRPRLAGRQWSTHAPTGRRLTRAR